MTALAASFLSLPIAHRAYHDRKSGRPENSRGAVAAAIKAGYGIEVDVQLSADGRAIVFHDYDLGRLTAEKGAVRQRTAADLGRIELRDCDEGIPTLEEILRITAGRVPLLIELKDQDGALGPAVGALEMATADAVRKYEGPIALMSFNPHSVDEMARLAPTTPRGITTCAYDAESWPLLPTRRRDELRKIPDYHRTRSCFISHEAADLGRERVCELKAAGAGVLCWTIRSHEAEAEARKIADNVTFEGYPAALPMG